MAATSIGRSVLAFLEGDDSDIERFREMRDRFRNPWIFGVLIGGCTVLAAASYGWWLAVLPVLAAATMAGGTAAQVRSPHPQVVIAMVGFALLELNIALSVLFTGGGSSPLLSLMVVPVFTQAVAFRPRVTAVWVAFSAGLALIALLGATRLDGTPAPSVLLQAVSYLALLGCLALGAHYFATAEVHSRGEASQDVLTGLLNRKALTSRFAHLAARLRTSGEPMTLLMVDVDHFKHINDTYGHPRGDLVLAELAQRLVENVRPGDLVFRFGGEEFLVLMPELDQETARFSAERLNRAVSNSLIAGLPVTVSVGVTSGQGDALDYDRMVQAADAAMYQAKRDGRACVRAS